MRGLVYDAFAYNVQYAGSCIYSNIRYNIQCRIRNFLLLHCEIATILS